MLYWPTSPDVLSAFDGLLAQGSDEHELHSFMVRNTEFIPAFVQLNHGVLHGCVFNKLPIAHYETDFVYVTKSSDRVRIVLTEIEPSTRALFTGKRGGVGMSAHLTDALDQVRVWRSALGKPATRGAVLEALRGFLWDTDFNEIPIDFRYQLLIGRRPDNAAQLSKLGDLSEETGVEIKTYDSIRDAVERGSSERMLVLAVRNGGFAVLNWDIHPSALHGTVPLHRLRLTTEDEELFSRWGYPIEEWDRRDRTISLRDMVDEQVKYAEWRSAQKVLPTGTG